MACTPCKLKRSSQSARTSVISTRNSARLQPAMTAFAAILIVGRTVIGRDQPDHFSWRERGRRRTCVQRAPASADYRRGIDPAWTIFGRVFVVTQFELRGARPPFSIEIQCRCGGAHCFRFQWREVQPGSAARLPSKRVGQHRRCYPASSQNQPRVIQFVFRRGLHRDALPGPPHSPNKAGTASGSYCREPASPGRARLESTRRLFAESARRRGVVLRKTEDASRRAQVLRQTVEIRKGRAGRLGNRSREMPASWQRRFGANAKASPAGVRVVRMPGQVVQVGKAHVRVLIRGARCFNACAPTVRPPPGHQLSRFIRSTPRLAGRRFVRARG